MADNFNNGLAKRKSSVDLSTMVYGKVPPQAKELEQAILGACMLEKNALDVALSIINTESFYIDAHQRVFNAIKALSQRNQGIDTMTVCEQLKTSEELETVGGPYFVTRLTNSVVTGAHIETHARIIQQKFIQRELIRVSSETINQAYEDSADAFELLDMAEERFLSIGRGGTSGDMIHIENVMQQAVTQIEKYRLHDTHITGVPTGFPSLDSATRGWQPGLIIIGARPSVGKTALALEIANAASSNDTKKVAVGIWSLEMKAVQQGIRMLSAKSETYLTRLQTGRIDDEGMKKVYVAVDALIKQPIFFDEGFGLTLMSLRSKARRLQRKMEKTKTPLGLIVIDYLQLVTGGIQKGNREQEISSISRGLKQLSMELDVPVIALSQLSRDVDKGGKKREPVLSDLRESGALEQDADMVIFIWAPEESEIEENADLINRRYIRIAKQRDGILAKIDLEFKTEIQRITEYAPPPAEKKTGNWKPVTKDMFADKNDLPF